MQPLITVIVPVYNTDKYLDECLNSIRQQTYSNLEIILVNNGSTDMSGEVCDRHAAEDQRIKAIHTDNIGAPRALNMGLDMANGEYIAFADGDDWLEPDMFQYLYDNLIAYNADISACSYFRGREDKQVVEHPFTEPIVCDRDKAINMLLQDKILRSFYWDKLYKREIFNELHFPRAWDIAFTYQAIYKAERVVLLPEPKYHYVVRGSSVVMKNSPQRCLSYFRSVYMQTSDLLEKGYPLAARYMVRRGLRTINDLIKAGGSDEDIRDILDKIQPHHKSVGLLQLGPGYRRRWWMMEHCLPTYRKLFLLFHSH
jgi:glycosyltransferase involved in cell wall biosynthesis